MTYDRKRLDEAIGKIAGNGLKPSEIIETPDGSQGPPEVRYRAHVAFSTAYDILQKMEQIHNRRKAFIYVSNGYDFDPFSKSRAKAANDRYSQMTGGQNSDGKQIYVYNSANSKAVVKSIQATIALCSTNGN